MPVRLTFKSDDSKVPVKIWTNDVEESAYQQLERLSQMPFIHKHIAVMPDVHWGMGSTVGSVVPTINAIIPASVGVDIGCGMMAVKLNLKADQLPTSLEPLRGLLEASIPHGRTDNGGRNDRGAWGAPPSDVEHNWHLLISDPRYTLLLKECPKVFGERTNGERQLGTLGTGNHFVEVCLDKEQNVWIMLHSGSRGIGNRIGSYFINEAKELMEQFHIDLPDPDLAFLPSKNPIFYYYWRALSWAQEYAAVNRTLMMQAAMRAISEFMGREVTTSETAVNCHHNYVSVEHHFGERVFVTRKGAVRARKGDLGIIPGSMGARSFIVRGLGNPESFDSCSHGAGRKMSRGAARKQFTVEDLKAQTEGVECRKDADVIDEIPGAYKDIQEVMDNQTDLVEIVAELKQILCVKG
jgi:tRNA-splicing ligase RtcB